MNALIDIFLLEDAPESRDQLAPIFEITISLYDRYLDFIAPYYANNLFAFYEITYWLICYLKTLITSTTPRGTHKKSNSDGTPRSYERGMNVIDYSKWRLDSGAMMCVVWHIMLFNGLAPNIDVFGDVFETASIIVSFHNDIISYNRDLQQRTPNLVTSMKDEDDDDFSAMIKAVSVVNSLYTKVAKDVEELASSEKKEPDQMLICSIVLDILEGSYSWAYAEPKYAPGIKMLKALMETDKKTFYSILFGVNQTPGDPKKKIRLRTRE